MQKDEHTRTKCEWMIKQCKIPEVKHGYESVMVWGCFGNHKVGDLVKIEGIMTKESYHQILIKHAIPRGKSLTGDITG